MSIFPQPYDKKNGCLPYAFTFCSAMENDGPRERDNVHPSPTMKHYCGVPTL